MKYLFITLILLLAFATAFAQKDSLQIISHWKKTGIRSYKVVKINTRQTDSEQMRSDTETYKFRFVVMDSTKSGYRIKWDFDDSPILDELTEDEYNDLTNQFGGLEMIYTTDRKGVFKEIENWKDVSRYFTAYYNIKYDEEPKKDSARVIGDYKRMKEEISTREGVENVFFSEMRLFHLPFGNTLPVRDTVRYDGRLQVGPGEDYAASHIKSFFSDVDPQSGEAILNKITRVDKDDAKFKLESIMQKNIDTMPTRTAKEKQEKEQAQKEVSNLKFDSSEDFSFRFNYKTGWPSVVYFKQSTDIDLKVTKSLTTMEVIIEEQK